MKHIIFDNEGDEDSEIFFEDEIDNLDKKLDGRILAIADLGLWNGRHPGYKIGKNNLDEIMWIGNHDYDTVFFDGYNVRKKSIHHDGTNYILFREVRENRNIDKLTSMIYDGEYISKSKLNYYTKSLRSYIKNIYGW